MKYECSNESQSSTFTLKNYKELTDEQKYLVSNEYKEKCLSILSASDLVDIILLGPTLELEPSNKNTPFILKNLKLNPHLNLTFTRDQQIVTNNGLVICNMGSEQRKQETEIMKHVFKKLNYKIIGEIKEPGTVEGGDFFAGGNDLCFIGEGLRTNMNGIEQMFDQDLFGTRRVAVVHDKYDLNQQRMHLDTVFNICSRNSCVMLETIMGESSKLKRTVTEYVRNKYTNEYDISRENIEFSKYVSDEGYKIIKATNEQQEKYGINFLNLGDSNLITVDESTSRSLIKSKMIKGNIDLIDYNAFVKMYGSVHCCSQVLSRECNYDD